MSDKLYIIEVGKELAEVAAIDTDIRDYQERAEMAARRLGPACIEILPRYYHYPNNPKKPDSIKDKFNGLGEWMERCQIAAFEIIYNFHEAALPYLRKVAFGSYDWPQGFAIAALCRLAAEGIERGKNIAELRLELPEMRYETHCRAAWMLLSMAREKPELKEILHELDVKEFQEAVAEILGSGGAI